MRYQSFVITVILITGGSQWSPAGANLAWVTHAMERIAPDTPLRELQSIELWAAKGETESFQIVLKGSGPRWTVQDLLCRGLKNEVDGTIGVPPENVILYLGHYLTIAEANGPLTAGTGQVLRVVDPLIPIRNPYSEFHENVACPFTILNAENRVIFVDIEVPPEIGPGKYVGRISVIYPGNLVQEDIMIKLNVWDFTLPQEPTIPTLFPLEQKVSAYHVQGGAKPSLKYWNVFWNYVSILDQHRLQSPLSGVNLQWNLDETGTIMEFDWRQFDHIAGQWFEGSAPGKRYRSTVVSAPFHPGSQGILERLAPVQYERIARELAAHYKEKLWFERALIPATYEPTSEALEDLTRHVECLIKGDQDWRGKVMVCSPALGLVEPIADILCVPIEQWNSLKLELKRTAAQSTTETDKPNASEPKPLWFYTSDRAADDQLSYSLDARYGHEPRLMKWGAWLEGAQGFYYRSLNDWSDDPWQVEGEAAGAGILIYPGDHNGALSPKGSPAGVMIDGPVPSYRLKMLRDGLEDWELLKLCESVGLKSLAQESASRLFKAFRPESAASGETPWNQNPQELLAVRKVLGEAVEQATKR